MGSHSAFPDGSEAPRAAAPGEIVWLWSGFEELSPHELYTILQLRQTVFVVEQTCPYLDADGYDQGAWHLRGWTSEGSGDLLCAYVRILPPGVKYVEPSIGRVLTHPRMRRTGLGKQLMLEAIRRSEMIAPGLPIRIGAQRYLERFYGDLGFRVTSEPYDEDGIMHVEMLRVPGGDSSGSDAGLPVQPEAEGGVPSA